MDVIGVPITERGVLRLSRRIFEFTRLYGSIGLPLPHSLCLLAVTAPSRVFDLAYEYMNSSQLRVWSSLIAIIPDLAYRFPDNTMVCYLSDDSFKSSEKFGYEIASLLVKAKAYNKVNVSEWLSLFKSRISGRTASNMPGVNLLVADGYSWAYRVYVEFKAEKFISIDKLIPTPLDLLELIAYGYIGESVAVKAIRHAIRYLGEYIITSRNLTEAYEKLANDREYISLIENLNLVKPVVI
ncbi:MAG: hypothetical protein QW784_02375 [Acidilobaceae archaeon]